MIKNILITGGSGMLGTAFTELLVGQNYQVRSLSHQDLDVCDLNGVLAQAEFKPNVVIHTAGIVNADYCEEHPEESRESHVGGTQNIVELCLKTGAQLFYPQSFLIFDGTELPITEETVPRPLSVYGQSKWEAEQLVKNKLPNALIVRMGGFFGGYEKDKNFVGKFAHVLKASIEANKKSLQAINRIWQPTFTEELARNSLLLLEQDKVGVYNMASHGSASFYEVAQLMLTVFGLKNRIEVEEVSPEHFNEKSKRPQNGTMENKRLAQENLDRMPDWRVSLTEYLRQPYFKNLFSHE
ncbi:MAG: NAD(P)-dependent oxidoreductase [Candidatus Yanofskybacteria bacterium]|nr:NAD(P)-dependent oxidoreductase [Candidatus Yanofskybacteria bacterium]